MTYKTYTNIEELRADYYGPSLPKGWAVLFCPCVRRAAHYNHAPVANCARCNGARTVIAEVTKKGDVWATAMAMAGHGE